jgi:hypothetical protein
MIGLVIGCSKGSSGGGTGDPKSFGSNTPDQTSPEALVRWFLTEHTKKEPDMKAIRKVLSKRLTKHFDEQPDEFERWVNHNGSERLEKVIDVGKGEPGSREGMMIVPAVIQSKGEQHSFKVKVIKEGDLWYWEDL